MLGPNRKGTGVGNFVLSYIICGISTTYGDSYLTVLGFNHNMHL